MKLKFIHSDAELKEHAESRQAMRTVNVNTSGLRDRTTEIVGVEEFYKVLEEMRRRWVEDRGAEGLKIKRIQGVEGNEGVEGAWQD
jgi:Protein of unknown function (DUF2855)